MTSRIVVNNIEADAGISTVTFGSNITVSTGSTNSPSITPTGDSNTGIFFPSADTVCIGTGSSEVVRVTNDFNVGVGSAIPQTKLDVVGGIKGAITSGTAVASTSGTAIDFTNIPSWVKRITVMFNQVSLSGTSGLLVQLGDAGGVETTGYASTVLNDSGSTTTDSTSGFILTNTGLANTVLWKGALYLNLVNTNTFLGTSSLTRAGGAQYASGVKELSQDIDRIRITTVNGTDTFDAGTINILYEG